mgnify:CR=1 FL=1
MSVWRQCSSCRKPIAYGAKYWVCSVSTCNRARSSVAFCSVQCWDAHVPVMNHRNAWCEDKRAPMEAASTADAAPTRRRRIARSGGGPQRDPADDEILIVASRLKAYIERKGGMKTSAEVLPVLSDIVREAARIAIENARDDGRRTVKARDFRRS